MTRRDFNARARVLPMLPPVARPTMADTRSYRADESPRVGDVVQLCRGPYGSGVVTAISDGRAICERVHARCSVTTPACARGHMQVEIERVELPVERLRTLPVYVTGPSGRIDNRVQAITGG